MEQELQQAQAIYQLLTEFFVTYSFQILGAFIIMGLGVYLAGKVSAVVLALCLRKDLDVTFSNFIANASKLLVIVMVAIIALGKVGISVTPFIAAIGALSLGAGLAMQGLLSNYGAGLNIIITQHFVVGDTISVQGVSGKVKEITLAFTVLSDEDDVEITIPNRHIVGEILHNSQSDTLAEETIGIAYDTDPEFAIRVIKQALVSTQGISQGKPALVGIQDFADSSITIGIRFWAPTEHYFETRFLANANIFKALQAEQIHLPYPQQEVRVLS